MALVAIIHETISGSTAYHLQQLVTFRESISWFQFKCANGWTYSLIYKCVNVNAAVNGLWCNHVDVHMKEYRAALEKFPKELTLFGGVLRFTFRLILVFLKTDKSLNISLVGCCVAVIVCHNLFLFICCCKCKVGLFALINSWLIGCRLINQLLID